MTDKSIDLEEQMHINPKETVGGGGKWPTANLNNYGFATGCPIDLKPSCILSLSVVLRSIKKIYQFGPWRDPGGPLIGMGPPISVLQGRF